MPFSLANFIGRHFVKPVSFDVSLSSIFEDAAKCDQLQRDSDFMLKMKLAATTRALQKQKYAPKEYTFSWGVFRIQEELAYRQTQNVSRLKTYPIKIKQSNK